MIKRIAAATAALGMLVAGPALAADAAKAQVSAVKGAVMVSQNGKLTTATRDSALRSGDRVVAKNGETSVKFSDGCQITLKPQAMLTVGATSPCASGAGLISANQGSSAALEGTGLFFATFLGGAAVVALIASATDDEGPLSP